MDCLRCGCEVLDAEQCYNLSEVCSDIVAIIEEQIGHEINGESVLCQECFEFSIETFKDRNENNSKEDVEEEPDVPTTPSPPSAPTKDLCVCCQTSLFNKLCHSLPEGPQRKSILQRIFPREVPPDCAVCSSCWLNACREVECAGDITDKNCVLCKIPLHNRRSEVIPDGLEKNIIAARIASQEITPGSRVCHKCWLWVVKRTKDRDVKSKQPNRCLVCLTSLVRKPAYSVPKGVHRKTILKKIYPRLITETSLLCQECWTLYQDPQTNYGHHYPIPDPIQFSVELLTYKKTSNSNKCCFVPGCIQAGRCGVPEPLRFNLLSHCKIYVGSQARICLEHMEMDISYLQYILSIEEFSNVFNANEIENMLSMLSSTKS